MEVGTRVVVSETIDEEGEGLTEVGTDKEGEDGPNTKENLEEEQQE